MPEHHGPTRSADDRAMDCPSQLHDAEARYAAFFNLSPDGILLLDPETMLPVEFNDRACQQLGYTREEFGKLSVYDHEARQSRREIDASVDDVLRDGHGALSVIHRTKSGELRNVRVMTRPVTLSGRTYFHCIWRDVTAEERTLEKLRENEERYRILFQTNPLPMWVYDRKTLAFLEVNDAALKHYGYSKDEFHRMTLKNIRPEEDVAGFLKAMPARLEGRKTYRGRHRKKDGAIMDVEVVATAIPSPEGDLALAVTQDLTERLRTERRLVTQHAVTRALADSGSIDEAAPRILKSVCVGMGWCVGAMWIVAAEDGNLHCLDLWHEGGLGCPRFDQETRALRLSKGEALPGSVWERRAPIWVPDVVAEPDYRRSGVAEAEGLHACLATPILSGDRVLGVVELYSSRILEPDPEVLAMMASLGGQIALALERVSSVQRLRRSEELLSGVLDSSLSGVMAFESLRGASGAIEDFVWLSCNSAAARMVGRGAQELLGKRLLVEMPGNRTEGLFDKYVTVVETGKPLHHEHYYEHEKVKTWFETQAVRMGDGFVVTFSDITERKQAEEQLLAERRFLKALLDTLTEGIVACDATGTLTLFNRATREFHGLPEEPLPPEHWAEHYDLYRVDGKTRMTTEEIPLYRAFNGHVVRDEEMMIVPKNGRPRRLLATGRAILDDEGRKMGAVTAMHDITERKLLEQQLYQAQKMEAVGRLAGGVAHDFNNLLAAILSFGTFAKEALSPADPAHADICEALDAAQRAAALTRQLLAFSRRQIVEPHVIGPRDVVSGTEKMLRRLLGEDIELRTALDPDVGRVRIDPAQLDQVLVNLAVNARDAMPHGGKLTIEARNATLDEAYAALHPGARSGEYVMLAVTDSGHGMSEEVKAHAFEPFFTTKEKGKGTGLGLATCYGIVKQAGGFIGLYSEPGQGACFRIYLPRVAEELDAPRPAAAAPGRGTETVLVVEDEHAIRAVAARTLRGYGYAVLEAETGGDALLQCERHTGPIDLLLTDVVMPRMSGRVLADRLARIRPALRVLYMSGYTDDAIVNHGMLEPGLHFIQKPFMPEALARKVREVLDSPSARTAPDAAP